jgi:hypothetical protein
MKHIFFKLLNEPLIKISFNSLRLSSECSTIPVLESKHLIESIVCYIEKCTLTLSHYILVVQLSNLASYLLMICI